MCQSWQLAIFRCQDFHGSYIPFFRFTVSRLTALCVMVESSSWEKQFRWRRQAVSRPPCRYYPLALPSQKSPAAELQLFLLWNGKNIFIPVGYWLTPSLEVPSSSQIYDSLRNCIRRIMWLILDPSGKRWHTQRSMLLLFLNFKAAFEMALFILCNVEDYHTTTASQHGFKRKLRTASVWSHENSLK